MTVPQDTVLCAGLGLLPALLAAGRPHADRVGPAWLAFAVGWLPVSAVFLLGWPSWSWWYPPGAFGELVAGPGPALILGFGLETAAFALALRWSRSRPEPIVRRAVFAIAIIYVCLLVLPAGRWLSVGTEAEFVAGAAKPLWSVAPLVATLAVGGAWLVLIQGLLVRRLRPSMLALSLLLVACRGEPAPPVEVSTRAPAAARLAVASDASRLVEALLEASLGARQDGIEGMPSVAVMEEGAAYVALINGEVDGAVVLRPPAPAEQTAAAGDGLLPNADLLQRALARDTIVLAVHLDHDIDVIGFDDAVALLTGERDRWTGLGADLGVTVVVPPRRDSARALVVVDLLAGRAMSGSAVELTNARAIADRIRSTPGAIGVTSLAAADGTRAVSLRTPLGQILEPHTSSQTGEWPLARTVLLVSQGTSHPQVEALYAFAGTARGRETVIAQGMTPASRGQ